MCDMITLQTTLTQNYKPVQSIFHELSPMSLFRYMMASTNRLIIFNLDRKIPTETMIRPRIFRIAYNIQLLKHYHVRIQHQQHFIYKMILPWFDYLIWFINLFRTCVALNLNLYITCSKHVPN